MQWDGVNANNTKTFIGTFTESPSNYTSAVKLGNGLLLPTGGDRTLTTGNLAGRGKIGNYWGSTQDAATGAAYYLRFGSNFVDVDNTINGRTNGFSIRCIAE